MTTRWKTPGWLPPVLTALILAGMLRWGWAAPFRSAPQVQGYFASVAGAIDEIPYQIGPWLGVDTVVTPAATELLKPNKLVQRRYTNTETGEWFELLVVHCGDVRDMIGHYPPVCYPAHGWTIGGETDEPIELGGEALPSGVYNMTRQNGLARDAIVVTDFFVLPSGHGPSVGAKLAIIQKAGRFFERARMGAAQVQVITPGEMPAARRREIVEKAVSLAADVLSEVREGPK